MTAPQARALLDCAMRADDLYDRAQRPRPSHVTPALNAALAAMLTGEIRVARESAAVMAAQGHNGPAAYVFTEVRRMGKLRAYYTGTREESDEKDL